MKQVREKRLRERWTLAELALFLSLRCASCVKVAERASLVQQEGRS